jgi:hypothetical protein
MLSYHDDQYFICFHISRRNPQHKSPTIANCRESPMTREGYRDVWLRMVEAIVPQFRGGSTSALSWSIMWLRAWNVNLTSIAQMRRKRSFLAHLLNLPVLGCSLIGVVVTYHHRGGSYWSRESCGPLQYITIVVCTEPCWLWNDLASLRNWLLMPTHRKPYLASWIPSLN